MVEIISQPDTSIILVFGQLIAVGKFGQRSPLTASNSYWSGMKFALF